MCMGETGASSKWKREPHMGHRVREDLPATEGRSGENRFRRDDTEQSRAQLLSFKDKEETLQAEKMRKQ